MTTAQSKVLTAWHRLPGTTFIVLAVAGLLLADKVYEQSLRDRAAAEAQETTARQLALLTQEGRVEYDRMPFDRVTVDSQTITPEGITVAGELRKLRCDFVGLTAYVTYADGKRERAFMATTLEETIRPGGDRPPSELAERWGPWLVIPREGRTPLSYQIFVRHTDCPLEPYRQSNLFASGEWVQTSQEIAQ